MSDTIGVMFGFLGGTIVGVESGYRALPHPSQDKIYQRLSDAKWFLALRWCDCLSTAAGILTNTGEFSFYNKIVLEIGEQRFIPRAYRKDIFAKCLQIEPNEIVTYSLDSLDRIIEIKAVEIDARYGKIALIKEIQ
ncbi:MAG: hypothetical protein QNJ38_06235 [Prochloraceae cyanobacterium]|nr:hypothetical protein [Prochloraceae cyanobacterium]